MRYASRCAIVVSRVGACLLYLSVSVFLGVRSAKSEPSARVILEVINKHFTMGHKIPSVYLRVFSDGTTECHTIKYTGSEVDIVKRQKLAQEELEKLEALIQTPQLLNVKKRYELTYSVVDSWMEWDIVVAREGGTQRIQVLNFSPNSARERKQPYPDVIVSLGCSVWKLRHEVYGDQPFPNHDCPDAFNGPVAAMRSLKQGVL